MNMTPCFRLATLSLTAALTGCAGLNGVTNTPPTIQGAVHGGQQPIVGAHVYLMEVNDTGNGGSGIAASPANASVSVLNAIATLHADSVGAYVLTDTGGNFTITGDYICNPGSVYYLYVLGGNPGSGANSAVGLMAGLAPCPSTGTYLVQDPFIIINEVSTVATAYALAGFATDATHISTSGSAAAVQAISYASLNVANLESLSTGAALATTPGGNGTVPQATINTLADILAACINSDGTISDGPPATSCYTLFANAVPGTNGTTATDTATAAINIAHNPGANVGTLFGLAVGNAAFQPGLAAAPNDFAVGILYDRASPAEVRSMAIDAQGSAWFIEDNSGLLIKLSSTGTPVFSAFTSATGDAKVAIDPSGNAWVVEYDSSNATEYSSSGSILGTFSGGGLSGPAGIAIDGNGNVFASDFEANRLSEFGNNGTPESGTAGYTGGGLYNPDGLAIDSQNNIWAADSGGFAVSKFSNSGVSLGKGSSPYAMSMYLQIPQYIAIDNSNNAWVSSIAINSLTVFSSSGTNLTPSGGYQGGGLSVPAVIAADGASNMWVANDGNGGAVAEFSNAGVALSPSTGLAPSSDSGLGTEALAIDGAGNVWLGNDYGTGAGSYGAVTELIGAAVPCVVPLSYAISINKVGARP